MPGVGSSLAAAPVCLESEFPWVFSKPPVAVLAFLVAPQLRLALPWEPEIAHAPLVRWWPRCLPSLGPRLALKPHVSRLSFHQKGLVPQVSPDRLQARAVVEYCTKKAGATLCVLVWDDALICSRVESQPW